MKMKVGDILKEEVKDMQGLHYPFKIIDLYIPRTKK